uniref:golgin subfamily A member 6-like protein 22 n=1 Tax=Monopterus albus TaxID=43700 RepID=UPI0009B4B3DC
MSLADPEWCPTSVQVTVLQARGLRIKGKSGTNDAYAVMQVGKEKYQTTVVEKCVAPVWKEEAAFELPSPLQQGGGAGRERSTLHVQVMHRALMGPDKLLGQAVINLLQLSEDKTREKTEWFKLLGKTGKTDKARGEVLLDIKFMRSNMTASMFDLSSAGKSRSRLDKFKDKVRGKKKESDTVSSVVPSFTQVLTDSEEEANGNEEAAAGKEKKKKKIKSLFSSKSNLQRNMSQSMSVLPAKNSSLSGSQSSGLNVESSEGKKKFKFMIHKRSDSKDSTSGHQKHVAVEQSNFCINSSHVYSEEPQPRASRIDSNFSLASSGHGSMDDVPESSPPFDSLKAVRQYSHWTEEEEDMAEIENIKEDEDDLRRKEEEMMEEERKRMEAERVKRQEELEKLAEEERQEQEERKRTDERLKRKEEERIQREEEMKRKKEEERVAQEELQRVAEEKKRLEEQEWMRIEEEKRQREERIRMAEERAQKERRRREEEHKLAEEQRRLEEERRTEEEKVRKEEEERIRKEEERAEEERVKRQNEEDEIRRREEAYKLAEEQRRLEEERRTEEEKVRKEEEERIRKEEERAEEERVKRQNEEDEIRRREEAYKLAEEMRLEEEEERRRIEEEKVRQEEEERIRKEEERAEEERREEEERRVRREEEECEEKRRLEEQERRRIEKVQREERIREEERARKEKEEYETVVEEKRPEEQEMIKMEEERIRKNEQERVRMEEERRQEEEERARKEMENKRLAEEQERKRVEEEEKIRKEERIKREEKAERERKEEEARKLEKEMLTGDAEEQKKRENGRKDVRKVGENKSKVAVESPTEVTFTNPFENFSYNPFEENPNPGPDSSTAKMSNDQQRCQSSVSWRGSKSISTDEKNLIRAQREKRPAPQPPGSSQTERLTQREQAISTQHLAQIGMETNDTDVKTSSILPQHTVQMITPLSKSPTDTTSTQSVMQSSNTEGTTSVAKLKRPAPSIPRCVEEELSSKSKAPLSTGGNISTGGGSEIKQVQIVYGLNPFEDDDENELTARDDTTTSVKTGSVLWPPAVSQAVDKDVASQVKIKSSKMAHAPPAPAKKAATLGTSIHQNTGGEHDTGVNVPDKSATHARDSEMMISVHVQENPLQESQPVTVQSIMEAPGVKKEVPTTASRRLQPVKPLNPLQQQSVSVAQGRKDKKSTGILCDLKEKPKVKDTGP